MVDFVDKSGIPPSRATPMSLEASEARILNCLGRTTMYVPSHATLLQPCSLGDISSVEILTMPTSQLVCLDLKR